MPDFIDSCRELHQVIYDLNQSPKASATLEVQDRVREFQHPTYIKSSDSRLLVTNLAYEEHFAGDHSSIGRMGETFLHQTILPVSRASDQLVLSGCGEVTFSHAGRDANGVAMKFESYKGSLLGKRKSNFAVFGVTRIVAVDEDDLQLHLLPLSQSWNIFRDIRPRDRSIAIQLAKGARLKAIAENESVSEKTIDNVRGAILKKLSLEHPNELITLMVRLQDAGFDDFGL